MFKPTIRIKIFAYFFISTMLALVITSLVVYFLLFQTLEKNETEYNVISSDKTKQSLEFALKLITNTGTLLGSNPELLNELNRTYSLNNSYYQLSQNKISTMLQNIISVQEYIKGIYCLSPKGNFYTSNWGVKENEIKALYASYLNNADKAKEYFTGIHSATYHPALKFNVISYIRPIFNLENGKILGVIVIDIDYELLKETLTRSSIQNDEKVLVINPKGENIFTYPYNVILDDIIIEHPILLREKKKEITGKVFGNDSIIVSNTIEYTGWKFIRVISSQKIHRETNSLETIAIYMFFVFLLICFYASFALSKTVTNPIKELNQKFKLVETGDLSVRTLIKGNDEMGELSNSFNNMVAKLNTLMEMQKKKSDMEFQILQAQINPHFLYNTLDSIKWLAVLQNVHTVSDMTTALINLLKYNISKNNTLVSVAEELDSVTNYVKIQKYRYGDIFNIQYDIDEGTIECKILRFSLQPIVENCIIHGFENIEGKGVIAIRSKIENDQLRIEIADNGSGMDQNTLECIVKSDNSKKKFSGIGINNIQERIKTYFGMNYGLSYESTPGLGTKAILTLPIVKKETDI